MRVDCRTTVVPAKAIDDLNRLVRVQVKVVSFLREHELLLVVVPGPVDGIGGTCTYHGNRMWP